MKSGSEKKYGLLALPACVLISLAMLCKIIILLLNLDMGLFGKIADIIAYGALVIFSWLDFLHPKQSDTE